MLLCFSSGARIGLPAFAKKKKKKNGRAFSAMALSRPSPTRELVPCMQHGSCCECCTCSTGFVSVDLLQHAFREVAVRLQMNEGLLSKIVPKPKRELLCFCYLSIWSCPCTLWLRITSSRPTTYETTLLDSHCGSLVESDQLWFRNDEGGRSCEE